MTPRSCCLSHLGPLTAPFQAPLVSVPAVTEITAISVMMTKNNMDIVIDTIIDVIDIVIDYR